ncbi:hypothetical protein IL306_004558 [Fusarium sp. DS 682]|nr:hypothetical protein IL306_004558 [Fusarium sp. DS 682]
MKLQAGVNSCNKAEGAITMTTFKLEQAGIEEFANVEDRERLAMAMRKLKERLATRPVDARRDTPNVGYRRLSQALDSQQEVNTNLQLAGAQLLFDIAESYYAPMPQSSQCLEVKLAGNEKALGKTNRKFHNLRRIMSAKKSHQRAQWIAAEAQRAANGFTDG